MLWVFLFIFLIAASLAGIIYLVCRIRRFQAIQRLAGGNKKIAAAIGFVLTAVVFALFWFTLGSMNAIIILLHLILFWLICDGVSGLIQKAKGMRFRRYYAGAAAILLTTAYLSAGCYAAYHVWETDYTLTTDKAVGNLRVLLVSDSHVGTTFDGDGLAEHMKKIQAQNPDVVLFAGDFVDDDTSKEDMIKSCKALGSLKAPYGVYYVFGNHDKGYYDNARRGYDGDDLKAELAANGVKVLEDEAVLIDDRAYIIGRQDRSEEMERGGSRASMSELVQGLDTDKYMIVMDHQPCDYDNQAASGVDLVVSGHTHGGQLFPLKQLGEWFHLGGNDWVYGLTERVNTKFIITSGISDWALIFKTDCKSEFAVIDIQGAER